MRGLLATLLAIMLVALPVHTYAQNQLYLSTSAPLSPRRLAFALRYGWTFDRKGNIVFVRLTPSAKAALAPLGVQILSSEETLSPNSANSPSVVLVDLSDAPTTENVVPLAVVLGQ